MGHIVSHFSFIRGSICLIFGILCYYHGVTNNPNEHCVFLLQVFGIIFTICQGKMMDSFNTLAGNLFLCGFLLIGTFITGADRSMLVYQTSCSSLIQYRVHTFLIWSYELLLLSNILIPGDDNASWKALY